MSLRTIRQPGPPAALRAACVPVGVVAVDRVLPAGARLLDALATLLEGGADSACLTLSGGALSPFAYVIPALSPDASHAAYYSDIRRPPGESALRVAAITIGLREGKPFFHCHALWTEADGRRACGHVLPDDTVIAAPIRASGAAIVGARFEVHPDAETGFSLFAPVATGRAIPADLRPGVAVRLAPNQDLSEALEGAGRAAGFGRAAIRGGVASLIGARFMDAPEIEGFATEMLVRRGDIRCSAGPASEIDVAIVDYRGAIGEGRLVPGDNPVLMTFEGVLEAA